MMTMDSADGPQIRQAVGSKAMKPKKEAASDLEWVKATAQGLQAMIPGLQFRLCHSVPGTSLGPWGPPFPRLYSVVTSRPSGGALGALTSSDLNSFLLPFGFSYQCL